MRKLKQPPVETETVGTRLLAGIVAIPLFEGALLFGIALVAGPKGTWWAIRMVPIWLHLALMSVAIATGLIFGYRGLVWLLGHLFYTHFPTERSSNVTAALWIAIAAGGALIYKISIT